MDSINSKFKNNLDKNKEINDNNQKNFFNFIIEICSEQVYKHINLKPDGIQALFLYTYTFYCILIDKDYESLIRTYLDIYTNFKQLNSMFPDYIRYSRSEKFLDNANKITPNTLKTHKNLLVKHILTYLIDDILYQTPKSLTYNMLKSIIKNPKYSYNKYFQKEEYVENIFKTRANVLYEKNNRFHKDELILLVGYIFIQFNIYTEEKIKQIGYTKDKFETEILEILDNLEFYNYSEIDDFLKNFNLLGNKIEIYNKKVLALFSVYLCDDLIKNIMKNYI